MTVLAVAGGEVGWGDRNRFGWPILVGFRRAADELIEFYCVERLILQQLAGNQVELVTVLFEDLLGFAVGLIKNAFDLTINFLGGLLAAIPLQAAIRSGQKGSIVPMGTAD
jgi:hypothetical protein